MVRSANRKREIFFFKQSSIGRLAIIGCAIVFNNGSRFLTDKWALFAASTIAWELLHVLDG
ncbi:hypothetical protein LOAG_12989 [Loa loa]|nr:hypothetical protein LOAG_12989 [Loa loa]EFO15521.1 hypothetical protein LOAG_12989 [Loa loa]